MQREKLKARAADDLKFADESEAEEVLHKPHNALPNVNKQVRTSGAVLCWCGGESFPRLSVHPFHNQIAAQIL